MIPTIASVLTSADAEWERWGRSTWHVPNHEVRIGKRDDDPAMARLVIDHYCAVGGGNPSVVDIQDDRYAWSAVGISAILKGAGYAKPQFPFAQAHSKFIRHFVKARKNGDGNAAFWAFRLGEAGGEPEVGDLVAYARGTGLTAVEAAKLFDSTSSYESHSDVVVARRNGEIDVIGCNVMDSVTKKTLRIGANGHILDNVHLWFATLKRH